MAGCDCVYVVGIFLFAAENFSIERGYGGYGGSSLSNPPNGSSCHYPHLCVRRNAFLRRGATKKRFAQRAKMWVMTRTAVGGIPSTKPNGQSRVLEVIRANPPYPRHPRSI